ncbi:MAG: cupin domain-containing protein [Kofleriaceae bacterium]
MKCQPEAARAGIVVDLAEVARELHADADASSVGHAARTVLREPDLRVVVIAMRAGATIAEHHASDTATVHVLHGRLQVRLGDRVVELGADHLLPIERGLAHEVVAIGASAFVLTLARSAA